MKGPRKRVFLKPVILAELIAVMLLAGIGVAFAITPVSFAPATGLWAGTTTIEDEGDLQVVDYAFDYDTALENVTAVSVNVSNTGLTYSHTGRIDVAISNGSTNTGNGTANTAATIAPGNYEVVSVALTSPVALADVVEMVIVVTGLTSTTP